MRLCCGTLIALLAVCPWLAGAGPATTTTSPTSRPTTTAAAAVGHPPFPADSLTMTAASTSVWNRGPLSVAELHGPVRIELGTAKLSADNAVVWLRPAPAGGGPRSVDVVLVGHANLTQDNVTFSYERYWVPALVAGPIRLVGPRTAVVDEASPTYRAAADLLREQRPAATRAWAASRPATAVAATGPATAPSDVVPLPPVGTPAAGPATPAGVLEFQGARQDRQRTADGNLAVVCTGGVHLQYRSAKGDLLEFASDSAVLFTDLRDVRAASGDGRNAVAEHVVSAYFEGDVRVLTTPASASRNELRARAERVYYEFATDRAVLTDVVLHTVDAKKGVPIFIRASVVRQLSQGEYKAENAELSTSPFATPTYGLGAGHIYVRGEDSGDPRVGERVTYAAQDVSLNAFGLPIIPVPAAGGTMTARGSIFRGIGVENTNRFGFGVRTDWGLFETLGGPPPTNVDASYRLDYYSYRGPAGGVDATYNGGSVSDVTKLPDNFQGGLHAYFVDDRGTDVLGSARYDEPVVHEFRGRVRYEHEQDVGDGLTAQIRLGYDSDSNFLPEYFYDEYQNGLPLDEQVYLKHAQGSEVASFLAEWQPNRAVTTADFEQENREVNYLPQLRYQRLGDSVAGDRLTYFGDSSATGNQFALSRLTLRQQGFVDVQDYFHPVGAYTDEYGSPGRPAFAYTGDPGTTTYVGDTRQEVDYPLHLGVVNVVPYAVGRYTIYSQGVDRFATVPTRDPRDPLSQPPPGTLRNVPNRVVVSSDRNRLLGAVGVRLTTDFWRVDDSVESDLFDIHRLRHVVTPEVNLFASAQTVDQNHLFIYDPSRDALNDVQAAQIALRQRWQTKRGGPGRWRSVDVFTLDLYANLFANQPAVRFRDPADFRSVFLQAEPEYSIPRNTANADATWRVSDTTAVLASVVQNLDYNRLAMANVGVAVNRGDRLSYFVGTRYIAALNSDEATVEASYQLDRKYSLSASESVDLAQNKNVDYQLAIIRRFDNFSASVEVHYDQASNDSGFGFNLSPNGLARGLGSTQLQQQQSP